MPFRFLTLLLCAACGQHTLLIAGERKPFPPEQQEKLARLVKQLGADRFDARDLAHNEIMKFGRRVRVPLEKFRNDGDPEIATRVAAIIAELKEGAEGDPTNFGLRWLARTQEADGHWDSVKHGAKNADIEQTALALLAFLGTGHTEKIGMHKDNVQRAVAWLRGKQREDGAIVLPGAKEVDGVAHALAALALCEAAGMANKPETKAAAQKATDYSTNVHQGATGFAKQAGSAAPDLFTTTLFVLHLRTARIAGLRVGEGPTKREPLTGALRYESFDKTIRFLDQVDDPKHHAFRNTPGENPSTQSTIMGALCRHFLVGWWKKVDLAPYIEAVAKEGPQADMLMNYMVLILIFQDWKAYQKFVVPLQANLRAAQRDDDEFDGSWDPAGERFGGGRVAETALCALCREFRGYRPMKLD